MKAIKIVVLFIFSILLLYFLYEYNSYRYYRSDSFKRFRTYLGYSLMDYYYTYYKKPDSIDAFIKHLGKQDKAIALQYKVNDLNYLLKNKPYLKFKQIKDSNTIILYHFGFDKKDNKLEQQVLDYDKLSFFDYLLKPKGDVMITWTYYNEICNLQYLEFEFYKEGVYTSDKRIEPIINSVYNNVWNYARQEFNISKTTYLLFKFYYLLDKWKGKLLCNWTDFDTLKAKKIKSKFEFELNQSQMNVYADSLIYYFAIGKK